MLNRITKIFLLFTFLIACEKPYTDPPVESGNEGLVVEGTITQNPPPYIVSLTKSTAYNKVYLPIKVTNAIVKITDDLGNVENVIEDPVNSGNYHTSTTGMRGTVGRSYKLNISLTELGNITNTYESEWEKLSDVPIIDSVSALRGNKITLGTEPDGSYGEFSQQGINLHMSAHSVVNNDYYYKFMASIIQQYIVIWHEPKPKPDVYIYGRFTNNLEIDKNLTSATAGQIVPIKEHAIGFVPTSYASVEYCIDRDCKSKILGDSFSTLFISKSSIYSVSKKMYQIFQDENTQMFPQNSIFDPVPTQITTNIKCTNKSSSKVFGYFCSAAVATQFNYFYLTTSGNTLYSDTISSIAHDFKPFISDTDNIPKYWHF